MDNNPRPTRQGRSLIPDDGLLDPVGVGLHHVLLPNRGGPCPSSMDHRIEFAMVQPPNVGMTVRQPSPWIWRVSLDGKRVGTVYGGDEGIGCTARSVDFQLLGRGYVIAEAAMQASVLGLSTLAPQREDGPASRRSA